MYGNYPLMHGGSGGAVQCTPPPPYLKILDFPKLFVVDAPMKKKIQKSSFTTHRALLFWLGNIAHALEG